MPGQVYPEQVRHARRSEEDARRVPRARTEIERRLGQLAARGCPDDLDTAAKRLGPTPAIDPSFEPVAGLGREAKGAPGPPNSGRGEVGALEEHVLGLRADLRVGATHHAGDTDRPPVIGDNRHAWVESPGHAVQCGERLAGLGPPGDHCRAAKLLQVVRMHRLIQLEHDVVGRVHHIVDGSHPDRFQSPGQPGGRGRDPDSAHDRAEQPGTSLDVLGTGPHSTDHSHVPHPPHLRNIDGGLGGQGRETERHTERRGQLARDSLVAQEIGAIGADIEHQSVIRQRHGLQQRRPGRGVGLQLPKAVAILSQAELTGGAEHAL